MPPHSEGYPGSAEVVVRPWPSADGIDEPATTADLLTAIRRAARQEQFLEVVSADEARGRFTRHVPHAPLAAETVALASALGRVLADDVSAPIDVPAFDRSNVDGFAVRASDTAGASDMGPRRLRLNSEVIVCGHAPALAVASGTATTIATGGVLPRGADAVVMIEHTDLMEHAGAAAIEVRRAVAPGQFVSYAGSDIARGEVILRRGTRVGSREIGMLAACGIAQLTLPCRSAPGSEAHHRGRSVGADRLRTRAPGICPSGAGRGRAWVDRIPDAQGIRLSHQLFPGRRVS